MCKFPVCSALLGMLSCRMSQHTVPSYQENTTVTLSNNFFLQLSKEKSKTRDQFQTKKSTPGSWLEAINYLLTSPSDLHKKVPVWLCSLLILHYSTSFPTTSISLASECLLDVGISGLLNQILHWDSSAWPIWNYIVFLLICVVLDALLLTWSQREEHERAFLCVWADGGCWGTDVFFSSQSHTVADVKTQRHIQTEAYNL